MKYNWIVLGLLQMTPSLTVSLLGDDPVRVNFCCPDGEMLKLRNVGEVKITECTRSKVVENKLEGMEVSILDLTKRINNNQTEFVKRKISKLDVKKPKCGRGLQLNEMIFNHKSK